jgi:hypothetical protein
MDGAGRARRRWVGRRSRDHRCALHVIPNHVRYFGDPKVSPEGTPSVMAVAAALCGVRRPTLTTATLPEAGVSITVT